MTTNRTLLLIVAAALLLRLAYGLAQDPLRPYSDTGGDEPWYLLNARALVGIAQADDAPTDVSNLASPPLYFLVLGAAQAAFGASAGAVIAVRVMQAVLGAAVCAFAYFLGVRLTDSPRAGLLAAGALAVSPVFILEAAQLTTEPLYLFLLTGGIAAFVEGLYARHPLRWLVVSGVLLGLATLTRAVLLAFPLLLSLQFIVHRFQLKAITAVPSDVPSWVRWRGAAALVAVYALVVLSWTAYSVARWDRWVIAGSGLPAFFYLGAAGSDDPQAIDQRLGVEPEADGERDYVGAAGATIAGDPLGYAARRVGELASALLQPHGTAYFPGESLRDLLLAALRGERSPLEVVRGEWFWPKLALYIFHYGALILGIVGMWRWRRSRAAWPMLAFVVYTLLVHLVLLALPRYLFPMLPFWYIFAAGAFVRNAIERSD